MADFYDQLAPYYHLIFQDWEAGIERQGERLSRLIEDTWGGTVRSVLDVACGIGTQAIGLARRGYDVTASDFSPRATDRARCEAQKRGLNIRFSVADMRYAHSHHAGPFDLVISCDNSITHLLTDQEILLALEQFFCCTRLGGGCLLTVRDYDKEERGRGLIKPYAVREEAGRKYVILQVWDFEGDHYDLSFYIIDEDPVAGTAETHVLKSRYYAVSPVRILQLMEEAGYGEVRRIDGDFYQPILVGTRPK